MLNLEIITKTMAKPFIVGLVLLIIVGLIVSFVIWGDEIKVKINEWQNNRTNTDTATDKTNDSSTADQNDTSDNSSDSTGIDSGNNDADNVEAGDRLLISSENIDKISAEEKCGVRFNNDDPAEYVDFDGFDISMKVPFNEKWGNDDYRILPYEIGDDEVIFGNIIMNDDCQWLREFKLKVADKRSVDEVKTDYTDSYATDVAVKKVNGYYIVEAQKDGKCDQVYLEVVGASKNFIFSAVCSQDLANDKALLEEVINSLSFNGVMLGMK